MVGKLSYLVIKTFCHRSTQVSQIRLNVPINYLLIVNVNLQLVVKRKAEKRKKRTLLLSSAKFHLTVQDGHKNA